MKKILSILLILNIFFTIGVFAEYSDVDEGASYAEAIGFLTELEVINGYEDGTFRPANEITRAETVVMLFRIRKEELADSNICFSDVDTDHWAFKYISNAFSLNMIDGYEDGTFRPDENITYDEALKMVMSISPFGAVAEALGGYPNGYRELAEDKGIVKGTLDNGKAVARATVARLLYNSLVVPFDNTEFNSSAPITSLLFRDLNIIKADAVIKKVPLNRKNESVELIYKSIDEVAEMNNWTIDSDGPPYKKMPNIVTPKSQIPYAAQGIRITAFIDVSDMENPRLAFFDYRGSRSDYIAFEPNQLDSKNYDTLQYYRNITDDKTDTIKIKPDILVYNNFSLGSIDDIKTANDRIDTQVYYRFSDTGNDWIFDIIYIANVESFIIEKIDGYKISSKNMSVELDPNDENIGFTINDVNGKDMGFSDIKIGDVINIRKSTDDDFTFYQIFICNETRLGTINEIYKVKNKTTDKFETFYIINRQINNRTYELDYQFHYTHSQAELDKNLKVGAEIEFKIDVDRKIMDYKIITD